MKRNMKNKENAIQEKSGTYHLVLLCAGAVLLLGRTWCRLCRSMGGLGLLVLPRLLLDLLLDLKHRFVADLGPCLKIKEDCLEWGLGGRELELTLLGIVLKEKAQVRDSVNHLQLDRHIGSISRMQFGRRQCINLQLLIFKLHRNYLEIKFK